MGSVTRLITLDDAPALARLAQQNRDFLAPWEPLRSETWFTEEGQRADVEVALERCELDTGVPLVITDADEVVGRMTISGIVRGALQSCSVGYWVDEAHTGRGLATAALGEALALAFEHLGLHRVQAETLIDNVASQKVLLRNGFVRYGMAPRYLNIAGRWQDCLMFQSLNPATGE